MDGTYTAFNRKEKRHFFFLSVWRQKMMMKIVSKKNVSIFLCLSSVLNMMYARVFLSSVHHIILYPPFNVSMISDCVCVFVCKQATSVCALHAPVPVGLCWRTHVAAVSVYYFTTVGCVEQHTRHSSIIIIIIYLG